MENNDLLNKTFELVEDNNKMLRKMRRAQTWSLIFTILKWLIITGLAVGIYYFFQPLLVQLSEIYSGLGEFYQSSGSFFENIGQTVSP